MALGRSAVLVSALAVGALLTTGSTYAAFSDYAEITGNEAGAGTVVIGGDGGAVPALSYSGLLPGGAASDTLQLQYAGSIPADVWIQLAPGASGTAFCDGGAAKPGGGLQVQVNGSGWVDYCSAVSGQHFAIASDVPPSTVLRAQVDVKLVEGTDARYSDLSGVGDLVVHALQSGGVGFSDYSPGTISIGLGTIAPTIPQQCLDAGLTGFDASNTIYLTPDDLPFDVGKLPDHGRGYLIIGTDGDDVITGSNQADCIIGGAGNDHLIGGNQSDVLIGGAGDDVLNGGGGDDKAGGNGKDELFGGAGDDELHGANGKDLLDAGDGTDMCVDTRNGKALSGKALSGKALSGKALSGNTPEDDELSPNGQDDGKGHGKSKDGVDEAAAGGGTPAGNPGGNGKDTLVSCEDDGTTTQHEGLADGTDAGAAGADGTQGDGSADTEGATGVTGDGNAAEAAPSTSRTATNETSTADETGPGAAPDEAAPATAARTDAGSDEPSPQPPGEATGQTAVSTEPSSLLPA